MRCKNCGFVKGSAAERVSMAAKISGAGQLAGALGLKMQDPGVAPAMLTLAGAHPRCWSRDEEHCEEMREEFSPSSYVFVTGGRDFCDAEVVDRELTLAAGSKRVVFVHGDARGLDTLVERWADERCYVTDPHPADWTNYGRAAGPIRNSEMVALAQKLAGEGKSVKLVSFPGGTGTADMTKKWIAAKLPAPRYAEED